MHYMFRARNVLVIQLTLVLILFFTVKILPDISFSSLAEEYVPIVAPWIYKEHFEKSIDVNKYDVFGYVNHHSVKSGDTFKLFLSSSKRGRVLNGVVEIFRVGYYETSDREIVYESESISVINQKVSISTHATGAAWKPLNRDISTAGWKSGYYAIDFVKNDGERLNDVAFIVVTSPQNSGDILIKLSTNTYQAYNLWGGSSFYKSKIGPPTDVVSFDRPTQAEFYRWEYYYVVWLEQLAKKYNLKIDYATNYDFYRTQNIADGYTLLMSLGHDEYWTQEEFDAYYNRIFKQGRNTIFLGANIAFWRVRYGDLHGSGEGRQLICYRTSLIYEGNIKEAKFDPIIYTDQGASKSTGLFRGAIGFPEVMLMGVGHESYFSRSDLRFSYKVKNIVPWIFEGTSLKQGDDLADIVGYEWDNTSLMDNGIPMWSEKNAHIPKIDREDLQIIFEGDVVDFRGKQGRAQAVYFETDAGAKVFSAGTLRWSWGVGKPGFINKQFMKINENLIVGLTKK